MPNLKTLALVAVLSAASMGAMAQHPAQHPAPRLDDIDARQARQVARIDAALHEGRLSRREFRLLKREQAEIRHYEARARADGVVTRRERRELQQMLDRASRHIRHS